MNEVKGTFGNSSTFSLSEWTNSLDVSGVSWSVVLYGGLAELGLHWLLFLTSVIVKTEKLYDLTGALGFLVVIAHAFIKTRSSHPTDDLRPFISSFLGFFWALRIGIYALVIALTRGERVNTRFHKVKHQPFRFFLFWTSQAIWVFVTSLPVNIINATTPPSVTPILTTTDWIGITLWLIGLTIECVADCQKMYLKINIEDSDKWLSTGLWQFVRYPNHSGEILVWTGIFLSCYSSLAHQRNLWIISLMSPICVILNIVFLSIPLLERKFDLKWSKEPGYQAYKRNTSALFPWKGLLSSKQEERKKRD